MGLETVVAGEFQAVQSLVFFGLGDPLLQLLAYRVLLALGAGRCLFLLKRQTLLQGVQRVLQLINFHPQLGGIVFLNG